MLNNSNTSLPSPTVAAQSSSSEPSTLVRQRCHLVETVEALRTRKSFPPYCRYSRFSAINDSFDYYPP
uniref:Uncharacterized protein n=1 Tax=Caenorhabditis japonica TaxID=281687 RepID=A0A8R1EQ49_CAEJA